MKIPVVRQILSANDQIAAENRAAFDAAGVFVANIMASPGAGKTSVIIRLLQDLSRDYSVGVIEGDVASSIDTDKLRALGFAATQINTDGGCHLDANMVLAAIDVLGVKGPGYLFIENIGNLICPTNFHLGESLRLVIASVPEGDDKPAKYPGVFATADAVVLNKMDLLAHVDFRMDFFVSCIRTINPKAPILNVSCRTGEGFPELLDWLKTNAKP